MEIRKFDKNSINDFLFKQIKLWNMGHRHFKQRYKCNV
jgi:hypothetical protein